jgi:hypothetical protein
VALDNRPLSQTNNRTLRRNVAASFDRLWFCGSVCWNRSFSIQQNAWKCALHQFIYAGFTDYGPKPGYGQFVVVGEVASGILFLIAAIPLLISRIATFESP